MYPTIFQECLTDFVGVTCLKFLSSADKPVPHAAIRILIYATRAGAAEYVRARIYAPEPASPKQGHEAEPTLAEVALTSQKGSESRSLN